MECVVIEFYYGIFGDVISLIVLIEGFYLGRSVLCLAKNKEVLTEFAIDVVVIVMHFKNSNLMNGI